MPCAAAVPPAPPGSPSPADSSTDSSAGRPARPRNPVDDGLYRNVWRHAAGTRARLVLSMLLLTGSQLVKLVVPLCAAKALDALQAGGPGMLARALAWVGGVLAAYVASWLLHGPGRVLERHVGMQVRASLADTLYARLAGAPLAWHERHHSSEMQQRASQSARALYEFAQNQFVYLHSIVNFVGPLAALACLSGSLGFFALAGYVTLAAVSARFDRTLTRLTQREMDLDRRYGAGLADFLGHMGTVLSLRLQQASRVLLRRRLDEAFEPMGRLIAVTEWKWCVVDLASTALTWSLVVGYVAVAAHHAGAGLAIGAVFMVYQYASQTAGVASAMAGQFQGLAHTRADFESARPIFDAPQRPAPAALPAGWQRIVVRDLAFRHAAAHPDAPSLGVAELVLHRGERIALVGGSGSGKSSLMRVLAGLYAAARVEIEVDGVVLPQAVDLATLATLIPQEADVFEGSVRENLDFGTAIDAARIDRAVDGSAFDAVLGALHGGLEFPVAQRGSNLSGGQRQRLCLARGVLAAAGSSIVFLDEPTSALDPLTEARVHHRLGETFPGACIVASVHRMGLLPHFDRVVVMDQGRIVDTGTVQELRARQPMFARMLAGEPAQPGAQVVPLARRAPAAA
jgi:ABC-type multidrug transport system fused ATPase/permease subunit